MEEKQVKLIDKPIEIQSMPWKDEAYNSLKNELKFLKALFVSLHPEMKEHLGNFKMDTEEGRVIVFVPDWVKPSVIFA